MRTTITIVFIISLVIILNACVPMNGLLRPLDDTLYAADRTAFLSELSKIAGPTAIDCGVFLPFRGNNSQGIACVRKSWEEQHAFTIVNEYRNGVCPNLVGYAGDSHGRVYHIESCPDRDHRKGRILQPKVYECPQYIPPTTQFGDGQCSVLDAI